MVSLCLTPPNIINQPIEATEKLFSALHGVLQASLHTERLLGLSKRLSLEIISSRTSGVQFIVRCPTDLADSIEHIVAGYIPELKVKIVADPLADVRSGRVTIFKQRLHYAYPIQTADALYQQDPISYLTNSMTKLKTDELIALQYVIQPTQKAEVRKLSQQMRRNEDVMSSLDGRKLATFLSNALMQLVNGISSAMLSGGSYYNRKVVDAHAKPARYLSSFEYELVATLDTKISKPLFDTAIRAVVTTKSKSAERLRTKSVQAAMNLYTVSKYQQLLPKRLVNPIRRYVELTALRHRLPSLGRPVVLSTHELASLYHFPNSSNTNTDNLVTSLSKTLAAPVSLKNGTKLDVLLGENEHHGTKTPIGLTAAERERHIYIVGGTGNGKTTMITYAITQDIAAGKGLAVIDPHGDLAETILDHIPQERIQDVIYLNPDDLQHPIAINLLEMRPGLAGDELLREKDLITEAVISVLRKIFSEDDTGGHRIEYVLRNTIQTALTVQGSTLFTIYELLNDTKFRNSVTKTLEDKDLKNFWKNEIGKAGEMQKVKMAAGITSKIGRFLFSASAKRMLDHEKSSINFEEIIDSGKILICNFSKGLVGEDTSALFGVTVLAKLQIAAFRRARLSQTNRVPFYLYVDEFQNFATMSFVQMLSEARKYKLFLTMAEQSTAQQDQQRLVDIILANVGTVICFRTGSPADEFKLLPLFKPYVKEGELSNLPSYNFYAKLAGTTAQEPLSGVTIVPAQSLVSSKERVIIQSRLLYSVPIKSNVRNEQPPQNATSNSKIRANKPSRQLESIK